MARYNKTPVLQRARIRKDAENNCLVISQAEYVASEMQIDIISFCDVLIITLLFIIYKDNTACIDRSNVIGRR